MWFRGLYDSCAIRRLARSGQKLRVEPLEDRAVPAVLFVTSGADDGPGSLRAALAAADADPDADAVFIRSQVRTITLDAPLGYAGAESLRLKGHGTVIQPAAGREGSFDLFEATGGADLTVEDLTFRAGRKGIDVVVPAGATGVLSVALKGVAVRDSVWHGLHIDDLTNATAAGVALDVRGSIIAGNGSDPNDFDGIRVDERGPGGITASFGTSTATANGGDGVELDERDAGSVRAAIWASAFTRNGSANAADLEDGFDIDEGGGGDLFIDATGARFDANSEGGLDVNEDDGDDPTDAGDLVARLTNATGSDNGDKGLDFSEGDGGGLWAAFVRVEASRNGTSADNLEEGIVLEEAGAGDVVAGFWSVTASGNGDDGIDIDETGDGNFVGVFVHVAANDNGAEGIDVDEADAGTFTIVLHDVESNDPLDVAD
jgi:hypothetical protein